MDKETDDLEPSRRVGAGLLITLTIVAVLAAIVYGLIF